MSDPLRIALVAEGPTDRIVVEAALRSILGARAFVLTQLQPEDSSVFGPLGGGWGGVYKWCKQSARRGGGRLSGDRLVFQGYDLLLLHVDADVAAQKYGDANVAPEGSDLPLPCEHACPPASATANALRAVLASWCGEVAAPPGTVFCVPSKSTEAWVVATLYPNDSAVQSGIECHPDPETRLGVQPKRVRIAKTKRDYQRCSAAFEAAWTRIASADACGEALRFHDELTDSVAALDARIGAGG